jgi:hypothetical protein
MFVLDDAIDEIPSERLRREECAHFLSFVVVFVLNECLEEMTMMMMGASMSAAGE